MDMKTKLLDNYWFGLKMINRGEATCQQPHKLKLGGLCSNI